MPGLLKSRKVQLALNLVVGGALLAVAALSARHFAQTGWPLRHADPVQPVPAGDIPREYTECPGNDGAAAADSTGTVSSRRASLHNQGEQQRR